MDETGKNGTASANGSRCRKQRNCVAQKAYRARQTLYIKELEKKLESLSVPQTERYSRLEESNRLYRNRLLDSYKKLESINISLQIVLESVGNALEIRHQHNSEHKGVDDREDGNSDATQPHYKLQSLENTDIVPLVPHRPRASWQNDLNGTEDISRAVLSGMDVDILDHTINDISLSQGDFSQRAGSEEGVEEIYNVGLDLPNNDRQLNISQDFSSATQAAPNSDDLDNFFWHLPFDVSQMGITGYKDMIQTASIIFEENDLRIFATNSPFSDHIWSVEQLIRQRLQDSPSVIHRSTRTIQNLVSSMISAFICISWKPMSSFLRYTKSHISVTKLTTSHVHNGQQNDSELEIYYRPTHTQLSTPHPAVIDWVPFPSIRDRLILFHASNPRLDEIICEIADAYACDIQLSRLVQGFSPTIGYIRVRDLLQTISRGAEEASDEMPYPSDDHDYVEYNLFSSHEFSQPINSTYNQTSSPSFSHERNSHASRSDLPAPSINALFSSRTLALQVFRLLGMDKGPGSLRLDPVFFRKHPELYDGRTDLLARGVPVRSPSNDTTRLAGPEPIDFRILRKYQEMVKSTFEITPIETWKDGDGFVAGV